MTAMWVAVLASAVTSVAREVLLWYRDVMRHACVERIAATTGPGSRIVDQQGAGLLIVERWR